ncbi:unnamed protein product [Spirodela intermedia]|uniref:Uncharacterized protein n=2 Tax=Spirodela intermedia TaxID=51605 RepID=A0A7I8J1Y5_SPIIN|nr:unnamed protein product [Spirodela intermedia]CAA6663401.1 unnamed protein product [Spirodela intermedia]CAA7399863.1 unnamed protein product [Spirodela intermedia]
MAKKITIVESEDLKMIPLDEIADFPLLKKKKFKYKRKIMMAMFSDSDFSTNEESEEKQNLCLMVIFDELISAFEFLQHKLKVIQKEKKILKESIKGLENKMGNI